MANDAEIHSRLLREKVSVKHSCVEFNSLTLHFLTANHALIPDCRRNSYTIKRNSYNPVRGRR